MYKKIVFAFCGYLISCGLFAQTNEIEKVLQEVEKNNNELQAFAGLIESKKLELNASNNLSDPQFGAYYLPWGDHSTGDYSEFQISQTFEFPSVYSSRKRVIKSQQTQLELEYNAKRQAILLAAKKYCLELIYWDKKEILEQKRVQQAKQVFNQLKELYEKEEVGILDYNKAKVAWIQEQFKVSQIEVEQNNLLLLLKNLNGNIALNFEQADYLNSLFIAAVDSVWNKKKGLDPEILLLEKEEEIALEKVKFNKQKSLPNLTAGFNYQGVTNENYSGIYGGISIPLWNNKNKVKAAKASYNFQQLNTNSQVLRFYSDFEKQYNEYEILLSKFQEYQETLNGLNSDALLLKSYEMGEISFMEYYIELKFYQEATNAMVEMERQLHQQKADILKYEL
ncbi:TolC family protein [bacterium]|nr:TolC family protein [bacterium]|tara:strand:- start:6030 stop:7214 length:1185 start_codon:yes stop_codon:yes gene_type:complete